MERKEANKELLRDVMNHIIEHPDEWYQEVWHCGSASCFAGRTQIMTGKMPDNDMARLDAMEALNISEGLADYLFDSSRTLTELYDTVKGLLNDEIDRDGYDLDGYDRYGYNRHGYDRDGYDPDGYDRNGYDPDGYDCFGYDRYRRDRDGYDRFGYDRDGNLTKLELL